MALHIIICEKNREKKIITLDVEDSLSELYDGNYSEITMNMRLLSAI